MAEFKTDGRAVTPAVSKALAVGLTVLYLAGVTTVLFSGVVPEYETRAGSELADRILATAAGEIEDTPTTATGQVNTQRTVELPPTIANEGYSLVLSNGSDRLILDHPESELRTETHLSLPPDVAVTNGTVDSVHDVRITLRGPAEAQTLTIEERDT